jgi:hypothetical protein
MNKKEKEKEEARNSLLNLIELKPGDTVYTQLKHVSKSGMSRVLELRVIKGDRLLRITWQATALGVGTYDKKHEGLKIGGCGMDMGFAAVYDLSRILFRGGWKCPGQNCDHPDHFNEGTPKDGNTFHPETSDAGYALHQEWI